MEKLSTHKLSISILYQPTYLLAKVDAAYLKVISNYRHEIKCLLVIRLGTDTDITNKLRNKFKYRYKRYTCPVVRWKNNFKKKKSSQRIEKKQMGEIVGREREEERKTVFVCVNEYICVYQWTYVFVCVCVSVDTCVFVCVCVSGHMCL